MSFLRKGNLALSRGQIEQALLQYRAGMSTHPELSPIYAMNIQRARLNSGKTKPHKLLRIGICVWEMSHNPAGRGLAIAEAYQKAGRSVPVHVELLGPCYDTWGGEVWAPLKNHSIRSHTFKPHALGDDNSSVFRAYYDFVKAHPKDIVHLIKPRGPALLMGLLYEQVHHAKVIFDCDDEELGFFKQGKNLDKLRQTIVTLADEESSLPSLKELPNKVWTHLSIYLLHYFSAVTVSNPALQKRYAGTIIPHSRSAEDFPANTEARRAVQQKERARFGIPEDAMVVLFSGTPRKHKGLERTAKALRSITSDLPCTPLLVVVGDFPDESLLTELKQILGTQLVLIPGQAYSELASVAAIGDLTVLLQENTVVSQFQVPAKLTEALAAGLIVLISRQPSLDGLIASGAVIEVDDKTLEGELKSWLSQLHRARNGHEVKEVTLQLQAGKDYFQRYLSHDVVGASLLNVAFSALLETPQQTPGSMRGLTRSLMLPKDVESAGRFSWYAEGQPRQWLFTQALRTGVGMEVNSIADKTSASDDGPGIKAVEKITVRSRHSTLEGLFYLANEIDLDQQQERHRFFLKIIRALLHADASLISQAEIDSQTSGILNIPRLLELELDEASCHVVLENVERSSVCSIGELGDYRQMSLGRLLYEIALFNCYQPDEHDPIAAGHEYQALLSDALTGEALQAIGIPVRNNYFEKRPFEALLENSDVQWLCAKEESSSCTTSLERLVKQIIELIPNVNEALQECPLVFSHNDLNRGNVFYDSVREQFVVLDWATVSYSPVGSELAQLLHPSFWTKSSTVYRNSDDLAEMETTIIFDLQQYADRFDNKHIWVGYLTRLLTQQFLLHLPRYATHARQDKKHSQSESISAKLDFFAAKLSQLAAFVK